MSKWTVTKDWTRPKDQTGPGVVRKRRYINLERSYAYVESQTYRVRKKGGKTSEHTIYVCVGPYSYKQFCMSLTEAEDVAEMLFPARKGAGHESTD